MTSAAMGSAAVAGPDRSVPDTRRSARALYASAFGILILVEAYVAWMGAAPPDMRLHYLLRAASWAAIDPTLWWACMLAADATHEGKALAARPYIAAAIVASVAAPFLHVVTQTWYFHLRPAGIEPPPAFVGWWIVGFVGAWRITLLTAAYYYRLRSLADETLLARARLDRAVLSRKAVESRLQALQGKVDPNLLFETLDDIEQACEWDAQHADRMLECLIAFLRGALPSTQEEGTTLAQEIALARAYLALAEARNPALTHAVEVQDDANHAAMAPMLLTPLVAQAVRAMRNAEGRVTVACTLEHGGVRIAIVARGGQASALWQSSQDVAEVAQRLEGVYGRAGSLSVGADGTDQMQIILRIPHEQAARGHR